MIFLTEESLKRSIIYSSNSKNNILKHFIFAPECYILLSLILNKNNVILKNWEFG